MREHWYTENGPKDEALAERTYAGEGVDMVAVAVSGDPDELRDEKPFGDPSNLDSEAHE